MHPEVPDQNMLSLSNRMGFLEEFSFYLAGDLQKEGHRACHKLNVFVIPASEARRESF